MAHIITKINGFIDANPGGTGQTTFIPGEFSSMPIFNAGAITDDIILVDCLYTINNGSQMYEAACINRFIVTYRTDGGGTVFYDNHQQLFEYWDGNDHYRSVTSGGIRYDFNPYSWYDGIALIPDSSTDIGPVMYELIITHR